MLQPVWAASGGQCGKYLAASMRTQLDALQRHGELVADQDRYSPQVRAELLAMSAATINRYRELGVSFDGALPLGGLLLWPPAGTHLATK